MQTTENSVIFFLIFFSWLSKKFDVPYTFCTLDFRVLKLCFGNSAPKEIFIKIIKFTLKCLILKSAKFCAYVEA
jgi:hypothetical protein